MANLLDYSTIQCLPEVWTKAKSAFGDVIALNDPHSKPETKISFSALATLIEQFAAGLQVLGVKPEAKVSLFADNSPRWLIADQGIMTAGAANIVRSAQAERSELLYILGDSDSSALVVQDLKTLQKLRPELDDLAIELIVLLSDEEGDGEEKFKIVNYNQVIALGIENKLQKVTQTTQTLATLIYTSGTTGKPKGAMLSHGNFLHQLRGIQVIVKPSPGDRLLSILPSWHAYERTCEYYLLSQGCTQYYTNIRFFKKDLKDIKPYFMVGVPRLWESIYEGVQKEFQEQPPTKQKLIKFFLSVSEQYILNQRIAQGLSLENLQPTAAEKLKANLQATLLRPLHNLADKIAYQKIRQAVGGNIKVLVSGGGSLANHIEDFFEIVQVPILVGYGLTETSPVATARTLERNLRGSAGQPLPETEIKIVDPESRENLPTGERGLVLIRGPQVMQGYYKNAEATQKAINSEGWFDSGDLGCLTPAGDLVLTGRAKDTIVLTNGENIEPQPIEDACLRSIYVNQIMLLGQDQRGLGALIVPNLETLAKWAASQKLDLKFPEATATPAEIAKSDLYRKPVVDLFRQELNREVQNRPGYRADDRIGAFRFILESFSIENGLMTQTLKLKRPVVTQRYQDMIEKMFKE